MVYYSPSKYNAEFCLLIGANPNINYSKANIYNILIANSKKVYQFFEFNGELKKYLEKIHNPGWSGYKKSTLMNMLNSLIISSIDNYGSKYVIISSNKSNIPVKKMTIIL
jgi:hypothetical protein